MLFIPHDHKQVGLQGVKMRVMADLSAWYFFGSRSWMVSRY